MAKKYDEMTDEEKRAHSASCARDSALEDTLIRHLLASLDGHLRANRKCAAIPGAGRAR